MVTRKTKFSISIEKLQIEFEGSQEVGQQIQQGVQQAIGGLMNTQARLLAMRSQPAQIIDGEVVDAVVPPGQAATDGNGDKQKQSRQRRSKSGPTVADLLSDLKQEGYFAQTRTGVEVQARLKDKGNNPRQSNVLTGLQRMAQKSELYREYNSENVYVYKDTPFHEGPRSPSPADQPAE
jgi:hypothetical protein